MTCVVIADVTCVYAAILPRWWRWPEEDLLGEEPGPAVAALRLVSVHAGHRQAHQEVCPVAERSGCVLDSRSPSVISINTGSFLIKLFLLLSVHGGKGTRYTPNEDTPPDKRRCWICVERSQQGSSTVSMFHPPESPKINVRFLFLPLAVGVCLEFPVCVSSLQSLPSC